MKTKDNIRIQSQKDPAQLEREIDQQRDHIVELVEALGNKLSPGEVFERVLGYGKEGGREFVGNLSQTVKSNPVPALLTAAGMLWLYTGGRHDSGSNYTTTSTSADLGGAHKSDLGERMQHVREGASEKIQGVRDTAHHAAETVKQRAHRANEGFHHMLEENPMALGAIGVAAGALLGAVLPVTRKEHELMGEASDHLTREARVMARSGYDAAAHRREGEATTTSSGGDGGQHPSSRSGGDTGEPRQQPPTT